MPLDSYQNLQNSVMDWLARPADPLISGVIPDLITLFEEEARDRLKTRFQEAQITLTPPGNTDTFALPLDYEYLREMWINTNYGKRHFTYQTGKNLDTNLYYFSLPGYPVAYTIEGLNLRVVGNPGDAPDPINIIYMQGLPALSATVPTNWLLKNYPSAYLFGTLTMAAPYIGDDPRLAVWLQGRESVMERIKLADRKNRWPEGLMIQTDTKNP
jgi:hypothetical protein